MKQHFKVKFKTIVTNYNFKLKFKVIINSPVPQNGCLYDRNTLD